MCLNYREEEEEGGREEGGAGNEREEGRLIFAKQQIFCAVNIIFNLCHFFYAKCAKKISSVIHFEQI